MIRFIFSALIINFYLLFAFIVFHPIYMILNLFSKKYAKKYARFMAKYWGYTSIWSTGNKVEVILKDKDLFKTIEDEPVVLVSNHQSNADIPLILAYLKKPVGFVAKKELRKYPFLGTWMENIGCVFLDRTNLREGIKSIKEAVQIVKKGNSLVVFPEGTRTKTGEVQEFKKGSLKIAFEAEVKIIPVTITGCYEIYENGNFSMKTGIKIKLILDSPIETKGLNKQEQKEIGNKIREIIIKNLKSVEN